MSKAEKLHEAINAAIPTSDLEWPGDEVVTSAVCRAICEELGITHAKEWVEEGVYVVDAETAEAINALLEVGGIE